MARHFQYGTVQVQGGGERTDAFTRGTHPKDTMSDQDKPCLKESEDAGDMMKDAGE